MEKGIIVKALSGFYYVKTADGLFSCKARGRFRLDGTSPLVGDRVEFSLEADGTGRVDNIEERRNFFIRPAVANIDCLVFIAANVNPVTDPFLIDRVTVIAEAAGCGAVICINKCDLDRETGYTPSMKKQATPLSAPAPSPARVSTSCGGFSPGGSAHLREIPA